MPLFHTYIITKPDNTSEYYDFKAMLKLTKKAIDSPKYQAWLKKAHLLPVWKDRVEETEFQVTKWEYIQIYLETQYGYKFQEV